LQRCAFVLLHLSLWRRVSLRAISFAQRECAEAEISGYLESLAPAERSPVDSGQTPDGVLFVLARQQLQSLSRVGLCGRQYAGAFDGRLREVLLPNGCAVGQHAAAGRWTRSRWATGSDPTAGRFYLSMELGGTVTTRVRPRRFGCAGVQRLRLSWPFGPGCAARWLGSHGSFPRT
jgi:hypothetical protein